MPSIDTKIRVATYVPHGSIPDHRGYAPAIVAWNLVRHMPHVAPMIVSAKERYPQAYEVVDDVPVHRIHEGRIYRRLFKKITRLDPYPLHVRALKVLAQEKWDLLHAHQLEFPVADFLRRLGRNKPVLLHAHVTTNVFNPDRGVADRYIAVSEYVRQRLIEVKGYPSERMTVVHNGVDVHRFAPGSAEERIQKRKELGIPESAPVVAFVGRKQEVKGFHIFLPAAAALLSRNRDLYVLAAGPELLEARREASYSGRQRWREDLRATGRYLELPAMSQGILASIYRCADITLLPSQAETQGMAMIESMASGCITVSSNIGGIRESIRHGDTGYLINQTDSVDEAVALCEHVLSRPSEWNAMRERARKEVTARFAWDVVARKLEKVFEDVVCARTN